MNKWAYPKRLRLVHRHQFSQVFDKLDLRFFTKGFVFLVKKNDQKVPRLGLVISKKTLRLACSRNKIKRLIRESFRLNQESLVGLDLVVISRHPIKNIPYQALRQQIDNQWLVIHRKFNQQFSIR